MNKIYSFFIAKSHLLVIIACAWLFFTCSKVILLASLPKHPGFFNYAHIVFGLIGAVASIFLLLDCSLAGKWKTFFFWLRLDLDELATDIKGLFKAKIPAAGGKGLYTLIESVTLLLMVLVSLTGIVWLFCASFSFHGVALEFRSLHIYLSIGLGVFLVAHIIAVATHLLDF